MEFRDLIFHNGRRKLFSLLLAILVWMTVHFAEKNERHPANNLSAPTNSLIYP
jgi:hypothetical protein